MGEDLPWRCRKGRSVKIVECFGGQQEFELVPPLAMKRPPPTVTASRSRNAHTRELSGHGRSRVPSGGAQVPEAARRSADHEDVPAEMKEAAN
jgi:hypothetical protein